MRKMLIFAYQNPRFLLIEIGKLILNIHIEFQGTQKSQKNPEKKKNMGVLTPPNFKTHYKSAVIKTVCSRHRTDI